jgi:hypothetical protein
VPCGLRLVPGGVRLLLPTTLAEGGVPASRQLPDSHYPAVVTVPGLTPVQRRDGEEASGGSCTGSIGQLCAEPAAAVRETGRGRIGATYPSVTAASGGRRVVGPLAGVAAVAHRERRWKGTKNRRGIGRQERHPRASQARQSQPEGTTGLWLARPVAARAPAANAVSGPWPGLAPLRQTRQGFAAYGRARAAGMSLKRDRDPGGWQG